MHLYITVEDVIELAVSHVHRDFLYAFYSPQFYSDNLLGLTSIDF